MQPLALEKNMFYFYSLKSGLAISTKIASVSFDKEIGKVLSP